MARTVGSQQQNRFAYTCKLTDTVITDGHVLFQETTVNFSQTVAHSFEVIQVGSITPFVAFASLSRTLNSFDPDV